MTITISAYSAKNIKLLEKMLVAGNFNFKKKSTLSIEQEISVTDFRAMIKARHPRIVGKSLEYIHTK